MAKPNFDDWKRQTLGHQIDLDNQSYDCVDVSKSWAQFVNGGQSWQKVFCWGNAKDLWFNAPAAYWDRVQDPKVGDIVCMSGAIGGGYGHTGVVVEVNGGNIVIYQQNTFTQQPVYTGVFNAHASYIQGYLRPKAEFTVGQVALAGNQRVTSDVVNYRSQPSRAGDVIKQFQAGETLDFKGFVKGEAVDGNPVWFVGAYTGGYIWSGGTTDISTHDLPDLTPQHSLESYQRQIGSDAMNYRKAPQVAPDNVIQLFPAGEVLDFKGWVHGQNIDGNDIWFVGKYSGGYVWSGGFVDKGTHDLPELTATTPPTTPTEPAPTTPVFTKELACVTEVIPAPESNYEKGNFPTQPKGVVLHDFGTDGRDTFGSTINHFKTPNIEVSPHFVVSGENIVQMVQLANRAWHAGPKGNDKVGIEIDPDVDTNPATKASVELLLKNLSLFYGYDLERYLHSEFMATSCGDDVKKAGLLDVAKPEEPKPTDPQDPGTTPPVKPPEHPTNIQTSVIRTVVPYIVGGIVALLAGQGITGSPEFIANLTAVITFLVGSAYYIVVRIIETKIPSAGVLLGSAKKPEYVEKVK